MSETRPTRDTPSSGRAPEPTDRERASATERCEIVAGRLAVVYEGAIHRLRREVLVTADQLAPMLLKGDPAEIGGQLLLNGDFADGVTGWRLAEGSRATFGTDRSADWTIDGGHTAYLADEGRDLLGARLDYVGPGPEGSVEMAGGRGYQLSALIGTRSCSALIVVEFADVDGQLLGSVVQRVPAGKPGGRSTADYERIIQAFTAPANTSSARLSIRKGPPAVGAGSSAVLIADVSLEWAGAQTLTSLLSDELRALVSSWQAPMLLALPLGARILDGRAHVLQVDDPVTGRRIDGSPLRVEAVAAVSGAIERIDGAQVHGWARSRAGDRVPIEVSIEVDGTEIACVMADEERPDGPHGFRVGLPSGYLDGGAHHIVVRARPSGIPLEDGVRLLPRVLTPWDSLVEYASDPLPVALSPLAGHRYRSLQLDAAAGLGQEDEAAAVRRRQLGRTHDTLVRGFLRNRSFPPLEFPRHDDPVVSIVIPVHDKFAVTYHCLSALLFAHVRVPFEVIVVDDASVDETVTLEDHVSGITVVHNDENLGFVGTCNRGATLARGRFITFLNNDTEPTAEWLDEILNVFEYFDDVGLVGSKLIYPDGRLQEAGGIVWADGNPWNYGRDKNAHQPEFNYTRQADYLSGAAITVRRETWAAVGGFSAEYAPAYFEDTDLAFKVRAHGEKTVYAPFSIVVHHEGLSSGTSVAAGMKRFQEVNRPRFKQRWASAFADQAVPGGDADLAKDRAVAGRVLFVDNAVPQPDRNAGGYAAIQEMRLIQSLGYKVTFFPENLAWLGADTEYLQRMGVEVVYAPFTKGLDDLLRTRGSEFDAIYVTRFEVAARFIDTIRHLAPRAKIMLTLADLHFLRQIRDALSGQGAMSKAVDTRQKELATIRAADVTLSYNEVEHAVILSHNLDTGQVVLAPWVVDPEPERLPARERRDIAFLGSYAHPPNAQAVRFFVAEVMPLLRERVPGVVFRVYGSGWPEHYTARLAADDVVFEGFVEEVADALGRCRVAVAPLVSGAGLKGKVIDAMSCGTPQVLSPIAAEGTGLRDGIEALIAEEPADWADAIATLHRDDDAWAQMSRAAVRRVEEAYSFARGQVLMREALRQAGVTPAARSEPLFINSARPRWHARPGDSGRD